MTIPPDKPVGLSSIRRPPKVPDVHIVPRSSFRKWIRALAEGVFVVGMVLAIYWLTEDRADRRVVSSWQDGVRFGQQLACRP